MIRDFGGRANARLGMIVDGAITGICICALAGAFNGFMITSFQVLPFIVEKIVLGAVLMLAVLFDTLKRRNSLV